MPSPIAHLAAGYAIYQFGCPTEARADHLPIWQRTVLFAVLGFSLAPDLDSGLGIIAGDLGAFHNHFTHSLFVGLGTSLLASLAMARFTQKKFSFWVGLSTFSIVVHIVMDYLTWGRGVMLLWPLTAERFRPHWPLFYGLHWSEGLFSVDHLWTILSEAAFAVILLMIVRLMIRKSDVS